MPDIYNKLCYFENCSMKFIVPLLLLFMVSHSAMRGPNIENSLINLKPTPPQDDLREKAFGILREKCNTCHATKKRAEVFTKENMSALAPEIYEQVFVKRKMPKGRKIKLTETETLLLERWIKGVVKEEILSEK